MENKTLNKLEQILDLQLTAPGFKYETENNRTHIFFENQLIMEISREQDDLSESFQFILHNEIKLKSPVSLLEKGSYSFDYRTVALTHKNVFVFKYLIFQYRDMNIFLKFNFYYKIGIQYSNSKNNELKISYSRADTVSFQLLAETQGEFYRNLNMPGTALLNWMNNIGLITDFDQCSNNQQLTEIINKLKTKNIFLIITNWLNRETVHSPRKSEKCNFNYYLEKLNINKIKYFLQYDNTVPVHDSEKFSVLKMRSGEPGINNPRILVDYFHQKGRDQLQDTLKEIFKYHSEGIYFDPVYYCFNNQREYEKTICKYDRQYSPYSAQIKSGFKIINDILSQLPEKDKIYFSNVLSHDLLSTIYLTDLPRNFKQGIQLFHDFYSQGFINFAVKIKLEEILNISHSNEKKLLLLLIIPVFILDNELLTFLQKPDSPKLTIMKYIQLRMSYRLYFSYVLNLFQNTGAIPFQIIKQKNEIYGILNGPALYCAVLHDRLLDSTFYLPPGKWYHVADSKIMDGDALYIHHEKKDTSLIFQKQGSIIPIINNTLYNNQDLPKELDFSIFPALENDETEKKFTFREILTNGKIIQHHFLITHKNNEIHIRYQADTDLNLNRFFKLHLIIEQAKVKEVILNEKKQFYKRNKNQNAIDLKILNKTNSYNLVIRLL